jgi:hypothetical protein
MKTFIDRRVDYITLITGVMKPPSRTFRVNFLVQKRMLQQFLRRGPFHWVDVQTLPKEVYQFLIQRVILKPRLQLLLETLHKAFDFLDNFVIVSPYQISPKKSYLSLRKILL